MRVAKTAESRFEVFPYDRNIPTITINSLGKLSFNKAAHQALVEPAAVLLMFDPATREIAIKTCEASDRRAYPVYKPRKNNAAVSAKAFFTYYGVEIEKSKKLTAELHGGMLIARL